MGNSPINFIDPLGLNRWVGGKFHLDFIVEDPKSSTGYSMVTYYPPDYNLITNNCRHVATRLKNEGIVSPENDSIWEAQFT